MAKAQDIFLDHFARLGVFSKVQALAGPLDSPEIKDSPEITIEGMIDRKYFFLNYHTEA